MSEVIVKVRADRLRPGQRFVFAEEFGGAGEVMTVAAVPTEEFGTLYVETEEGSELMFTPEQMVQLEVEEM